LKSYGALVIKLLSFITAMTVLRIADEQQEGWLVLLASINMSDDIYNITAKFIIYYII
jgi:hypothetical protein